MLSHLETFPFFGSLCSTVLTLHFLAASFLHWIQYNQIPPYSPELQLCPLLPSWCDMSVFPHDLQAPFDLSQGCAEAPESKGLRLLQIMVTDLACTPCCLVWGLFGVFCVGLVCLCVFVFYFFQTLHHSDLLKKAYMSELSSMLLIHFHFFSPWEYVRPSK